MPRSSFRFRTNEQTRPLRVDHGDDLALQEKRLVPQGRFHAGWLAVTGVLEATTGVALIVAPSLVCDVLLGQSLDPGPGQTVARVAGIALVALGAACGLSRSTLTKAVSPVVGPMLFYNLAIVFLLLQSRAETGVVGMAFWPAIGLHIAMAVWCCLTWRPGRTAGR